MIEPSAGDHGTLAKHFADAVSGMRLWHCSHSCENFTGAFALAGRIAVDSMDLIANGWHKLCSFPYVGMNHGFLKTFVVSLIAIVLVYYGVAWAVLRCFHDEDETGAEAAVSVDGLHQGNFVPSRGKHPKADIECMGSNYHTETLAGSSAPSQTNILIADVISHVNAFLTLHDVAEAATENLWLAALFDRGSTLLFPGSPRYLSLSVLRI
ncbi:MAG TPA: hypothetical protein VIH18_35110 [Candidatus Binatia bacterium]